MGSNDASNKSVEENAVHVGKNAYLAVDHQWGGDLFATTGARVEIWNHTRSQPVNTFDWGTDAVISVRFNPGDPNIMATSASDHSIALDSSERKLNKADEEIRVFSPLPLTTTRSTAEDEEAAATVGIPE